MTTPDTIPTEALEAAARALFEVDRLATDQPWDEIQEWDRDSYRDAVRAVAPHLIAEGRRQAEQAWRERWSTPSAPCPTCGETGGFHDHGMPDSKHDAYEVPRHLLRPSSNEVRAKPETHRPFDDDGVTYCGWATGSIVVDGCGEVWPCTTVRERRAARAGSTNG